MVNTFCLTMLRLHQIRYTGKTEGCYRLSQKTYPEFYLRVFSIRLTRL